MAAPDTDPAARPPATEPLRCLWDPASVAVVGASADVSKWGYWLAHGALAGRERRDVHLVARRGGSIGAKPVARRLTELDTVPELVAIAVPAASVEGVVRDATEMGARALLVVSDGLDHVPGRPGLAHDLAQRARAAGARLVGPSSLGIVDSARRLRLAWGRFTPGPVAVVSQSGQVGSELAHLLARDGSGVSRFASVGRQVDVTLEEVLDALAGDTATRAAIAYVEDIRAPEAFLAAASRLRAAGTPLVVVAAGTSDAGRAAAHSHTGALAGDLEVLDAACRSVGALRADTPFEAAALARALSSGVRPRGRRVGVVSDSGGQAALAADAASAAGLAVPPLPEGSRDELAATLPRGATAANPVDLAGAGERDMSAYAASVAAVADSGRVDAVLLSGYFGRYAEDSPTLAACERSVAERLGEVARRVPVLVHSMADDSATSRVLNAGRIPVLADVRQAAHTIAGCAAWSEWEPREPRPECPRHRPGAGVDLPYTAARELLARAGIAVARGGVARTAEEAVAISRRWAGATAVKATGIAHKTEIGGVALGLRTETEVAAAFEDLVGRLSQRGGVDGQVVPGLAVERMDERHGVVEVIVGMRHDPVFGAVVLVGAGGVAAELWRDTALELGPVTEDRALAMVRRLRIHRLLEGWRGSPACDTRALARCVAAVSRLPDIDPRVHSCEINPLRVAADGVLAVDALVTVAEHHAGEATS